MNVLRILAIGILAVATGCKSDPDPTPPPKPSTGTSSVMLSTVVERTGDSVESIREDAKSIRQDTDIVRQALAIGSSDVIRDGTPTEAPVPSVVATQVLGRIDAKVDNISQSADEISRETLRLTELSKEVEQLERSLTSLRLMLEETRIKAMEKLYSYISMFWVIGFVLIAAGGAVAFILNRTYGGSLVLLGVMMIGFASASQYYMEEIALVGAVLLVLGFVASIAMIAWSTLNSKRDSTAVHEMVEMVEILKETMTESERERIFGDDGLASRIQSDLTAKVIARIKERNGFRRLSEISPDEPPSAKPTAQSPKSPPRRS